MCICACLCAWTGAKSSELWKIFVVCNACSATKESKQLHALVCLCPNPVFPKLPYSEYEHLRPSGRLYTVYMSNYIKCLNQMKCSRFHKLYVGWCQKSLNPSSCSSNPLIPIKIILIPLVGCTTFLMIRERYISDFATYFLCLWAVQLAEHLLILTYKYLNCSSIITRDEFR